jgi:hypothetical protein
LGFASFKTTIEIVAWLGTYLIYNFAQKDPYKSDLWFRRELHVPHQNEVAQKIQDEVISHSHVSLELAANSHPHV